ncbi:UDP-2-acetamido-2,6-beta-L-arabino-hexul-4-ose reductase [Variovorax sp. W1I1]|uniref:UDP-2-acetamido-2,6-beta-L-arabino-hexul-4-ose reductase n=1 Tax=Variovorax sp. W1I1 TaxID=3042309 RepID=UPI0027840D07|nr:capsular polysaccharide biosynthesis protein CapF [Variovorax sp. W1I1]MDQ0606602.1 UDP-2-acetamido-2,6-beta-L-arabino-hexul-4-ose reductase [Variovorax sp. W1I1]
MSGSKRILITGADGFIARNLRLVLGERIDLQIHCFGHSDDVSRLPELLHGVDFVFHLAGVNRPKHPEEFYSGNAALTQALCDALATEVERSGRCPSVIFSSSVQAAQNNPYGLSKRAAEDLLFKLEASHGVPVHVFRLPNVFGKWCKPNYNSVVATFCHNIARDLPIQINDPLAPLTLVYVDDVVERFVQLLDGADSLKADSGFSVMTPQYTSTVGEVARQIEAFRESRSTLVTERVGGGFVRALYSTYVSHLPVELFAYSISQYADPRGVFVEMLKTPDCGQFSYFTAHPGITRGGHYHHSKTEKFLVIKGRAKFRFRHMHTGEVYELLTDGDKAEVVETVPGWTHDIKNIGADEMIVMLWANEIFDRARPDTFTCPV